MLPMRASSPQLRLRQPEMGRQCGAVRETRRSAFHSEGSRRLDRPGAYRRSYACPVLDSPFARGRLRDVESRPRANATGQWPGGAPQEGGTRSADHPPDLPGRPQATGGGGLRPGRPGPGRAAAGRGRPTVPRAGAGSLLVSESFTGATADPAFVATEGACLTGAARPRRRSASRTR
ncbi:hypothetical protein KCH_37900 [Kitasatospora cheerisanensis KCTC 2395]|uniref:Uncharacterized protein n=1 Tax=Kitasatospora cheerisanensis KCTC 2395 TaxID=1348663 RepID=A0A066YVI1_9ACTN|nr:hypothetical protein KCH_37900 [Kitasatospora cheerisanensis KCTC 2395]